MGQTGRVELWFPKGYFSNQEANIFVQRITKPLNLPMVEQPEESFTTYDMKRAGDRQYIDAFAADVTYQEAGLCLIAFMRLSDEYRHKNGAFEKEETIQSSQHRLTDRVHLGAGLFGQRQLAAAPSTEAFI